MSKLLFTLLGMSLLVYESSALGDWGLNQDFIVENCQSKAVGACEEFRGRSNQTNGSGSIAIWKVGTKRIVSMSAATPKVNDLIKDKLDFSHILFADFKACPMEKDIPGHRIRYCIESIRNLKWVQSE
ncbi:MAG: hypothetical protein ACXVCE_17470 [Bacteriovorax sp.]